MGQSFDINAKYHKTLKMQGIQLFANDLFNKLPIYYVANI